jgi:phage head maturation protease
MKATLLRATSKEGFPFSFEIRKSFSVDEETDEMIIEGVASTDTVDHDHERMAEAALHAMTNIVNTEGVPLRWEHQKDENAIFGNVYRAWVDERNQMHIRASLDKSHPISPMLHQALKRGERFGFSVGGRITDAEKELSESTGKPVNTFYDILLDEVSVTKKPANYDSWIEDITKSRKDLPSSKDLYEEFTFRNPSFDYLAQIAKSIPERSWEKVDRLSINKNRVMESKESKEEKEKSYVSKAQFDSFQADVTKGIQSITDLLKAMGEDAMDTTNPDKKKDEDATQQKAKARAKKGGEDAMDTTNPDKKKQEDDTQQKAKAMESEEEKEKSADSEESKETKKSEDSKESKEEKSYGSEEEKEKAMDSEEEKEKAMDSEESKEEKKKTREGQEDEGGNGTEKGIKGAISTITALTKKLRGVKKTQSVEKSDSSVSDIDAFSKAVADHMNAVTERLEKSGTSIPGYANNVMSMIRQDKELQKEIRKMIAEPSARKSMSVSNGTAYAITKDGQRFQLTAAAPKEEIKKSLKDINFKDLYKQDFSAFREE